MYKKNVFTYHSLSSTRKIRPKRRHTATSRNPLKTMSMCLEVKSEYTEVITGVAEKELKRIQTAKSKAITLCKRNFLCISVLKIASGPRVKICQQ